jgi:hypothetical protein
MLEYIKSLLPRLRKFSESLDYIEMLVDQPWVLIDENMNKRQYIFERDDRLILSLNGNVQIGGWEYIAAAKSLLLHLGNVHTLLNEDFVTKGLLILKKDGLFDVPFVLANQALIPDLNIKKYLIEFLKEHTNIRVLAMEAGFDLVYTTDENGTFVPGMPVSKIDGKVEDGTYKVAGEDLWLVVQDGRYLYKLLQISVKTEEGFTLDYVAQFPDVQPNTPLKIQGQNVVDGTYKIADQNYWWLVKDSKFVRKVWRRDLVTDKGVVTVDSKTSDIEPGDFVHVQGVAVADQKYKIKKDPDTTTFTTFRGEIISVGTKNNVSPLLILFLMVLTALAVIIGITFFKS